MIFCPKKFEFSLCQNWELRYLNGFFVVDQKGSVVTVCCIWDRLAEIHSSGKITFGAQAVENGDCNDSIHNDERKIEKRQHSKKRDN